MTLLLGIGLTIFLTICIAIWAGIRAWDNGRGPREFDDDLFDLSPRSPVRPQARTLRMADGREVLLVQQAPGTNGMAVASLVLGLLGISLLGLIFGAIALGQIDKNTGQQGRGMAIAGIVLSVFWLAAWVIVYVLMFNALQSTST